MSHIFGQDVDFNYNLTSKFRSENAITFPTLTTSEKGFTFFHTVNEKFYGWTGTEWLDFSIGAGDFLPLAGGTMTGQINMGTSSVNFNSGFSIKNNGSNNYIDLSTGNLTIRDQADSFAQMLVIGQAAKTLDITLNTRFIKPTAASLNSLDIQLGSTTTTYGPSSDYGAIFFQSNGDFALAVNHSVNGGHTADLRFIANTARRVYTFQDADGTVAFLSDVSAGSISDTVYGVGWNAVTTIGASKNAIYDKIETLVDISTSQSISGIKTFNDALHAGSGNIIFNDDASTTGYASGGSMGYLTGSQYYFFQDHATVAQVAGILDFDSLTTSDKIYTFPDKAGTVAMTSDIPDHGGVVKFSTSNFATATSGPEDVALYAMPADTLDTNGDSIIIELGGSYVSNANSKGCVVELENNIGTTKMGVANFLPVNRSGEFEVTCIITRTGTSAWSYRVMSTYSTPTGPASLSQPVSIASGGATSWSSAKDIKIIANGGAANDVEVHSYTYRLIKAL